MRIWGTGSAGTGRPGAIGGGKESGDSCGYRSGDNQVIIYDGYVKLSIKVDKPRTYIDAHLYAQSKQVVDAFLNYSPT